MTQDELPTLNYVFCKGRDSHAIKPTIEKMSGQGLTASPEGGDILTFNRFQGAKSPSAYLIPINEEGQVHYVTAYFPEMFEEPESKDDLRHLRECERELRNFRRYHNFTNQGGEVWIKFAEQEGVTDDNFGQYEIQEDDRTQFQNLLREYLSANQDPPFRRVAILGYTENDRNSSKERSDRNSLERLFLDVARGVSCPALLALS